METKKLLQKISLALFWMNVSLMQTPGLRRTPAASVLSIVDMITAYFWNSADVLMWTQRKNRQTLQRTKARFQLAFAFSHDAKVFLMDEPAAGLDPLFRKELMGYMQEIVEDGTRSILFPPISPKIWIRSEITFF